jgi:hypothetical protein
MTRATLIEDKERMDKIAKTMEETEADIWQNRYIFWIAVALGHILEWIESRYER